jgi:tryptophan-rich sensory protein
MTDKKKLIASIAVPLIGGSLAGYFATRKAEEKYHKLKNPDFAPPSWVFPVAWTTLYTLMGIAKYDFDKKNNSLHLQHRANVAYRIQLGLNFLWPFLFFRWNLRGPALAEAALLKGMVSLSAYYFFKKSKTAGVLMVPYMLWTDYALAINYKTWEMNRGL